MLFEVFTDRVTRRQHLAWEILVRKAMADDDMGSEEGYVFHGTDHVSAQRILVEGFRATAYPEGHPDTPIFWGTANMAAGYAERNARADSPPVLIRARTRDVLASGRAVRDPFATQDGCAFRGDPFEGRRIPEIRGDPDGWFASYVETGAFVVYDGCRVPGLRVMGIWGIPMHPSAVDARRNREGCRWQTQIHPGDAWSLQPMSIETDPAVLFPHRFLQHDSYVAEFHPELAGSRSARDDQIPTP